VSALLYNGYDGAGPDLAKTRTEAGVSKVITVDGGVDANPQQERHHRLAERALGYYAIGEASAVFIRENGGLVYRVETGREGPRFVLKIIMPVGEDPSSRPDRLRAGLLWLAAVARETDLIVQEPVPNRQGDLLTALPAAEGDTALFCSLQRWVHGEHAKGGLSPRQAARLGAMLARLHEHGRRWLPAAPIDAQVIDAACLDEAIARLADVVDLGIVTPAEWAAVEGAGPRLRAAIAAEDPPGPAWGPLHGDLHEGNVLFGGDEARPIDFGGWMCGPLLYDLGVTIYHLLHRDGAVRRSLVEGYHRTRALDDRALARVDHYVCAAALLNLAYNVTIPSQRNSPLFQRNVREFVTVYCLSFVAGAPLALA
jgi:Ser/Thr protein kinase RdoA (MazF antagonist)